jgi:hypothetical protein
MVNFLQFIFVQIILRLIIWLLLFPISWLLLTPLILIGVVFTKQRYRDAVKNGYRNVTEFWTRAQII